MYAYIYIYMCVDIYRGGGIDTQLWIGIQNVYIEGPKRQDRARSLPSSICKCLCLYLYGVNPSDKEI